MASFVAAVILAGCTSPTSSGWTAVRLTQDGELRVMMSLCAGENPNHISLFDHGQNGGEMNGSWSVLAPYPPVEQPQREFTAFEAPAGCEVTHANLEPLVEGRVYGLSVATRGYPVTSNQTGPRRTDITFRIEDLRALDENQVLVSAPTDDSGTVMSVDAFEDRAQNSCP